MDNKDVVLKTRIRIHICKSLAHYDIQSIHIIQYFPIVRYKIDRTQRIASLTLNYFLPDKEYSQRGNI